MVAKVQLSFEIKRGGFPKVEGKIPIPGLQSLVATFFGSTTIHPLVYNPQNEMFSHFGTKRYNFKNETQLFKVIPHTSKNQKKSTGFAGTKYI